MKIAPLEDRIVLHHAWTKDQLADWKWDLTQRGFEHVKTTHFPERDDGRLFSADYWKRQRRGPMGRFRRSEVFIIFWESVQ